LRRAACCCCCFHNTDDASFVISAAALSAALAHAGEPVRRFHAVWMRRMTDDARLAYHKARYDAAVTRVEALEKSVKVRAA
jgi:hypothetical protein